MNEETTIGRTCPIRITGYADGVYNVEIHRHGEVENIEVSREDAERLCEFLDVDFPDPGPRRVEQWE